MEKWDKEMGKGKIIKTNVWQNYAYLKITLDGKKWDEKMCGRKIIQWKMCKKVILILKIP